MSQPRSCLSALFTLAGIVAASDAQALSLVYQPSDSAAQTMQGSVARSQSRLMLGTLHERRGDPALLSGVGIASSAWMRVVGEDFSQSRRHGTFDPHYNGDTLGVQAGLDLFAHDWGNGHQDRFGLFVGYARTQGTTDNARTISIAGVPGILPGFSRTIRTHVRQDLENTSLGGYWTHIGPGNWYVDTVLMGSWGEADVLPARGGRTNSDTTAFTASVEAGYPIALGTVLTLEPQAQLVALHTDFDPARRTDGGIHATFDTPASVAGRFGLRLQGRFTIGGATVLPYGVASLWHTASGTDTVSLQDMTAEHKSGSTDLEVRIGLAVRIGQNAAAYADLGTSTDIAGSGTQRATRGTVGARFSW